MNQLNLFINKDLILLDINDYKILHDRVNILRNKSIELVRFYNSKVINNSNLCSIQDIDKMNDIIQDLLNNVLNPLVNELRESLSNVFKKYEIKNH